MAQILTIHGWAFCPEVFKSLKGLGDIEHYTLGYESLEEEALKVASKIAHQTIIVGWSLGATLGVLASFIKKPKGLVLIGSTPHFGKAWKRQYIESFLEDLEKNFEGKIEEFRQIAWGKNICKKTKLEKERTIKLLKEFIETDISESVKSLGIPTLLVHGRKDNITPFREAKRMLKLNPHLKLIPYDGGHFPKEFTQRDWKKILKSFGEL